MADPVKVASLLASAKQWVLIKAGQHRPSERREWDEAAKEAQRLLDELIDKVSP